MLKILFFGDVNGRIGREALKKALPKLKKTYGANLVIANAENSAHGKGMTESTISELMDAGINWFTSGDHAFNKESQLDSVYGGNLPVLRPANYAEGLPGRGQALIEVVGEKVLLINLIGRVFMHMDYDCPFRKIDQILAKANLEHPDLSAIIVDMHAEATSEKIALTHYLDGRVSAVLGTHTHVMTADAAISKQGTASITDLGMVGAAGQVLGVEKTNIINTFLTQIRHPHEIPETGPAIINGVFLVIDPDTRKTVEIKPIIEYTNI